MAVGGEDVEQWIEGHAERIHLPPRELLDARTVEPHAIRVPRLHLHDVTVATRDRRFVVKAVAGIQREV